MRRFLWEWKVENISKVNWGRVWGNGRMGTRGPCGWAGYRRGVGGRIKGGREIGYVFVLFELPLTSLNE